LIETHSFVTWPPTNPSKPCTLYSNIWRSQITNFPLLNKLVGKTNTPKKTLKNPKKPLKKSPPKDQKNQIFS
jgi:hypothetical protein